MTLRETHCTRDIAPQVAEALEEWQEEAEGALDALAHPANPARPAADTIVGDWGPPGSGSPNLTILPEGAFLGSDGCNQLVGQGTFVGDEFRFGRVVGTMVRCPGVDTWLSRAATARLEGGVLVVLDGRGERLGFLERR